MAMSEPETEASARRLSKRAHSSSAAASVCGRIFLPSPSWPPLFRPFWACLQAISARLPLSPPSSTKTVITPFRNPTTMYYTHDTMTPSRSNLGLEKSGWDDLQLSAYGASNEVVFSHLDEHFQDVVDIRNFSAQAWEELKEDIEGFPFNGRTLNRTNVESCLLHYLRHTSNLQLAASFSAYLRESGRVCLLSV